MKRTLFLFLLLSLSGLIQAQTSSFASHTIYCENITSIDASNEMKNYLMNNYGDRVIAYEANLDAKTALITSDVQPIDLLQLYRMNGYVAIYIDSDGNRYFLNDNGMQMIMYKQ